VEVAHDINYTDARFPVQYVIRPQTEDLHDYRGYAEKVISGIYKTGDRVTVQPSGFESIISNIEIGGKIVEEAFAPQSVVLHLKDDIDISRGDLIVKTESQPRVENELDVLLCWMGNKALKPGNRYLLQINSKLVKAVVKEIEYKLDVNSLQKEPAPEHAHLNDIIKVKNKDGFPNTF
jgi:sulfate adenylyltransferase subunit 1